MPSVRSVQSNTGGVRTAFALGSSSAPTLLLTFASGLLGPDGVAGIGGIVDKVLLMPASSQAAARTASVFLTSSSAPALGPSNQIGREVVNVVPLVVPGPYRAKSMYQVWGYIDSTAADIYGSVEASELY